MFVTTRMIRRLGGVGVAALLGSALVTVAPAGPAAAAVPGLTTVQAGSVSNSVGKAVTVSCPPGTLVVDAGGYVTGVVGQVVLDDITPNAGLGSVTVTGYETDGTGANWRVHAFAKCADPLPGQVLVPKNSANDSRNKSVTANCPPGTNVIGVGSQTSGPSLGNVITDRIAPNASLTSVTVSAKEDGTFTKNWMLTAYAICADAPPGLIGIAGTTASSANKVETVTCPAGTVAIGTGAQVSGARDDAMFAAMLPSSATSGATGVEEDPTARTWALTTFGICATR